MKFRSVVGWGALALGVALSLAPLVLPDREIPTREHHLDHALMMLVGIVAGIAWAAPDEDGESPLWLWLTVLSPIVAMMLMSPSLYAVVEKSAVLHTLDHLIYVILAFVAAYAGQKYVRGVGWASALLLESMAVVAAFGYGIAPAQTQAATPAAALSPAEVARGKQLYAANCAACHGAHGEGGVGPTLVNESSRKTLEQAEAWIEKPVAPMPALYPSVLKKADVTAVAEFIETLK